MNSVLDRVHALKLSFDAAMIAGSGVDDLAKLPKLLALKELDISNTLVTDLTPLLGRTDLISISCRRPPVSPGKKAALRQASSQ